MRKIWLLIAAVALVALLAACSLLSPKTTIDQCVANFMSDINSSDRSNVYTNLDLTSSMYAGVKSATFWDILFPAAGIPYSLAGQSTSGSVVSATINSSYATFTGGLPISFTMDTDATGNAVIHSISLNGTSVFY